MEKIIFTFIERCVACKGCEIACAVEHSQAKNLFAAIHETPPPRSRVKVGSAGAYTYPARCQHCREAACIAACPMGAMTRNPTTDAVFVDGDKCIGCWMCVTVCPFGGVSADPVGHKAQKCDLCPDRTTQGGDPACVAACPTRALWFATPEQMAALRRDETTRAVVGDVGPQVAASISLWRTLKGEVSA